MALLFVKSHTRAPSPFSALSPTVTPPLALVSGCHRLSLGWHRLQGNIPAPSMLPLAETAIYLPSLLPNWKKTIIG